LARVITRIPLIVVAEVVVVVAAAAVVVIVVVIVAAAAAAVVVEELVVAAAVVAAAAGSTCVLFTRVILRGGVIGYVLTSIPAYMCSSFSGCVPATLILRPADQHAHD